MKKRICLYTDGACRGNPGPGGWAALLVYDGREKLISGGEADTTNNRMEMMGVIRGLRQLSEPCHVHIHTDSKYVLQGFTEWVAGWAKRGWKTADKKPVKNVDLWQALVEAARPHELQWTWVKGHAGHVENERVDVAAVAEAAKFKRA